MNFWIKNFPTIDPKRPYVLTEAEEEVLDRLTQAFVNCEKLQSHMHFLLSKGGLYKVYNNNLLYHGCIPLNEDGSFKSVKYTGVLTKERHFMRCWKAM